MSYNGWTNYATWCLHLWITNEEPLYRAWLDEARTSWEDADPNSWETRREAAQSDLADKLKDSWEYQASEDTTNEGFWSDLQSWALAQVDWHEVAAALLEEVEDE